MRTIRRGNSGVDVRNWQQFLRGGQTDENGECNVDEKDVVKIDGDFGRITEMATKKWQASVGLSADGIVGKDTWAAAVAHGFTPDGVPTKEETDLAPGDDLDKEDEELDLVLPDFGLDKNSPQWPPRPAGAVPLTSKESRDRAFGKIEYVSSPKPKNPESINITNGWSKDNIGKFLIPALSKNPISMHKKAGPQFQAWFEACAAYGLDDRVLSYGGCWVPRFVRGSRKNLSNHSWGTAIDINVPYNGRGRRSALLGKKGCVRELAAICYDFGIFWGGWYRGAPEDGMHFELCRVLSSDELTAAKKKHGVG